MPDDRVALEEKEEDAKEFHHHRFWLNTIKDCQPDKYNSINWKIRLFLASGTCYRTSFSRKSIGHFREIGKANYTYFCAEEKGPNQEKNDGICFQRLFFALKKLLKSW
jgi:hypothetical protein